MAFSRVSTTLIPIVAGDGTVTDAKVASNAAIAFSKLAPLTSGNLLIGNGSNAAASVAMSGDATISNTGVLTIAGITNAKVSVSAAIAYSKLASLATGQVLLGNAGVPTATTISGDATVSAAGVLTISNNAVTAAKVLTSEVAVLGTAQQYTRTHNFTATALTDNATIAWDLSQNQVAVVTLAGNRAMGNPTNIVAGAVYILIVKQDATGGRTLSFPFGTSGAGNTGYRFAGATSASGAPTLSTGANKIDILTFVATASTDGTHLYGVSSLNYA